MVFFTQPSNNVLALDSSQKENAVFSQVKSQNGLQMHCEEDVFEKPTPQQQQPCQQDKTNLQDAKQLFGFIQGNSQQEVQALIAKASGSVNATFVHKLAKLCEQFAQIVHQTTRSKTFSLTQIQARLDTFYKALDKLLWFVDQHYRCFMDMVQRCGDRPILQTWCMTGLIQQPFYHSLDLAHLIVNAQCFVDNLSFTNAADVFEKLTDYQCPCCDKLLQKPVILSCAHCVCTTCLTGVTDRCPSCSKVQPIHKTVYKTNDNLVRFLTKNYYSNPVFLSHQREQKTPTLQPIERMVSHASLTDTEKKIPFSLSETLDALMTEEATCTAPLLPRKNEYGILSSLRQLLEVATPGCFVALDIDETIQMSSYAPSILLSNKGIQTYQKMLNTEPYKSMPLDFLNERRNRLQAALHAKRLVESDTKEVIEELQQRGCWVFGLTSRYNEMAAHTSTVLKQLGIDLASRAPFPVGKSLRDPQTNALCQDGVIFTNATNKAFILDRFLTNVVFRNVGQASPETRAALPPRVFFVDDRIENVKHLSMGMKSTTKLNIPVCSYHFIPAEVAEEEATAAALLAEKCKNIRSTRIPTEDDIVYRQVYHFLTQGDVLTDFQAVELIQLTESSEQEKVMVHSP